MKFGKVIGQIIASGKVESVEGATLYVVGYLDEKLRETGKIAACVDTVNANPGDTVILCSSSSARLTKTTRYMCVDNSIVGIVDSIASDKKNWYQRK